MALVLAIAGCSPDERPLAAANPVNVVLISIDTLRADHLGCYGYERDTSPNLDRLAASGVRVRDCIAESSWTLPTHATLFTGVSQLVHGLNRGRERLAPGFITLAERLAEAGYATHALWSGPYLHPVFGFDQGFDDYLTVVGETCYDRPDLDQDEDKGEAVRATHQASHRSVTSPAISDRAIEFLAAAGDRPFFLFLHYFDVHGDYIPPEPYWRRFDPDHPGPDDPDRFALDDLPDDLPPADLNHLVARYDGEIRFTDEHVGRVLDALERHGLAERTLVVVTADHGEEFLEHGSLGHRKTVYDEVVRVPLLMRLPGALPAGARLDVQARQLDVLPTVLGLVGLPVPAAVMGTDLTPMTTGARKPVDLPAVARLIKLNPTKPSHDAVRDGRFKLVRVAAAEGGVQDLLFDLSADPAEARPLTGTEAERRIATLRERLDQFTRYELELRAQFAEDGDGVVALPAELERNLRELGYIR